MKFAILATALILSGILFSSTSHAQLSAPRLADKESGVQTISFIESGEVVYNYRWTLTRESEAPKSTYKISGFGDNNTRGAKRIEWTEESIIEVSPAGLRTLSWTKKSTGDEKMNWSLRYDWNGKKIQYDFFDEATGKRANKTLDLASNALGGDSMYWALRGFPFEKGPGASINGGIIDAEGNALSGNIIHRGEETLDTAFGKIACYKLEMKPTGVIGVVAPKMYLWYTKELPHVWVRFDGRDDGLTRPRTKNLLLEYEPRSAIR